MSDRGRETSECGSGSGDDTSATAESTRISDYLDPGRISLDLSTTSRKRLFEHIAELSSSKLDQITEDCIFKTITERERLGSTGLGRGIAVPHGRVENLLQPVVSIVRLQDPIDYDSPDDLPVWLAVGLLVPVDANDTHLKLLSLLVTRFQDKEFIESIRNCTEVNQVVTLFDDMVESSDPLGGGAELAEQETAPI